MNLHEYLPAPRTTLRTLRSVGRHKACSEAATSGRRRLGAPTPLLHRQGNDQCAGRQADPTLQRRHDLLHEAPRLRWLAAAIRQSCLRNERECECAHSGGATSNDFPHRPSVLAGDLPARALERALTSMSVVLGFDILSSK